MNSTIPRYYEIAVDFATKISSGEYSVGEKVYIRTVLATRYGTSPETARRAMCVLADLGIVEATKGSGVVVLSVSKAEEFVRRHLGSLDLLQMKVDMQERLLKQSEELKTLSDQMDKLMEKAQRFRTAAPLSPYLITVPVGSPLAGKTLAEARFWQNTGATLVAVRRNEELILSPGPHIAFMENDMLYYIGAEECVGRVDQLVHEG